MFMVLRATILMAILLTALPVGAVEKFTCQGSSPSWSIEAGGTYIRYKTPTVTENMSLKITERKSLSDGKVIIRTTFSTMVAIPGVCQVEGSRRSYSYFVSFGENHGNSILPSHGCCNPL